MTDDIPNPSKDDFEQYVGKPLTEEEYKEALQNLASFIEMLSEIQQQLGLMEESNQAKEN